MSNYKRNEESKNKNYNGGIYCITNIVNGKKYIGQTYDLKYRWMHHKSDLRGNRHHNKHLQGAWNKYGEKSFEFSELERCELNKLDEREIYWINYYNTLDQKYGYNLADGGLGCRGYKHTDEEIAKMRMIQNPKPIVMLDLNGNYIKTFVSAGEAGDFLGKESVSGIKRCCEKDKYRKAYGYIWVYEKDYKSGNIDWNYYLTKCANQAKPVLQYDLNMNLIREYSSSFETNNFGYKSSSVSEVCNGKRNTYYNYIWIWKDNPDKYFNGKKDREEKSKNKKDLKTQKILQYTLEGDYLKEWVS